MNTNISRDIELHPQIEKLYQEYKEEMQFWHPNANHNPTDKRFYVYIWFTVKDKKIFYVGKGIGNRVKHILKEIEQHEKAPNKHYKGARYKQIKDRWGIDYKILIDGITDYEAEIYEYCLMREYTAQGEVLLNFVDMPVDETVLDGEFEPIIYKDKFYERYLCDVTTPVFDTVEIDTLSETYFYKCGIYTQNVVSCNRAQDIIMQWLKLANGRVYKTLSKSVKSVIVMGIIDYELFLNWKRKKLKIYNAKEVVQIVQSHPHYQFKSNVKKFISVPKYDIAVRNETRKFLIQMNDEIKMYGQTNGDGFQEEMQGIALKKQGRIKEALIQFYISIEKKFDAPALYQQTAIILHKLGLFSEEIEVLSKGLNCCHKDNIHYFELRERYEKAIETEKMDKLKSKLE